MGMGKRANIRAIRAATETAVWQTQAERLRAQGAIPETAGATEARKFSQASANHHGRHATMWVVFVVVIALPALGIIGAGALWFLIPLAALLGVLHLSSASDEAAMTEAQRARVIVEKQVRAGARWGNGQCTWCGSVVQHRNADRALIHPMGYHAEEIAAAVDQRVIAQFGTDGRR